MDKQQTRPDWVKEVERTDDGTLLIVEGADGKRRGVRIPSKPIRPTLSVQTCGNSYDQWDSDGCRNGGGVLDQCEQCTDWEAQHWGAPSRTEPDIWRVISQQELK